MDFDSVLLAKKLSGGGGGGGGITPAFKTALLDCFSKVAWIDGDGQVYYGALLDALYPLVSISAIYTQGGAIYDTDSLDDLKNNLVVTALYGNNETGIVTDYVLSGSLAVGTSAITVTYRDKTDTFNVTVTSYKDRMFYKYTDGDLTKIASYSAWDTHGLYTELPNGSNNRRSFVITNGEKPFKNKASSYSDTDYYPIPIPSSATKVTIAITPNTQYVGPSMLNLINNEYRRDLDPGWSQGGNTYTFTAGTYEYMTFSCKMNSGGSAYTTEPSELTITFE